MKLMLRIALVVVCLLLAGFCLFGFMATFEPGVRHAMIFRIGYGVVGLGCIAMIAAVVTSAARGHR